MDNGTVAWWLQQPRAAELGKALQDPKTPVPVEALGMLNNLPELSKIPGFTSWDQVTGVWAKGPATDLAILSSAYAVFGAGVPWHFRAERCCRTVIALAGGEAEVRPDLSNMRPHHAADDCLWQCVEVQKAMTVLGRSL